MAGQPIGSRSDANRHAQAAATVKAPENCIKGIATFDMCFMCGETAKNKLIYGLERAWNEPVSGRELQEMLRL